MIRTVLQQRTAVIRLAVACSVALGALAADSARAASVWEMLPYRVRLIVAVEPAPDWPPGIEGDLAADLLDRCGAVIGALWDTSQAPPPPALRRAMLASLDSVALEELPEECLDQDKTMLVVVRTKTGGYEVAVRELDVRSQVWSTTVTRPVWQPSKLRDASFAAVAKAFRPLARIEHPEEDLVSLRPRGGSLPTRATTPDWIPPGTVFQAVVRRNKRDGTVGAITRIPWTFLFAEEVEPARVRGRIHSGLRSPLSGRRRGRIEYLALAVVPPQEPTVLRVESRAEPRRPLPGYDVLAHAPGSRMPETVGRTDLRGQVTVEPAPIPLRLLVIVSGGRPVARLPVVPGLEPVLSAYIPADDERLAAEGFLVGVREQLIDLVTRREILLARTQSRLASGDYDEARKMVDEIEALQRQKEALRQKLNAHEKVSVSTDPAVQARIDALFKKTRELLAQHLDDAVLREISKRLLDAPAGSP